MGELEILKRCASSRKEVTSTRHDMFNVLVLIEDLCTSAIKIRDEQAYEKDRAQEDVQEDVQEDDDSRGDR